MKTKANTPSPQRTALVSVIAAATLVVIKLVVGLLSHSLGVLAEAIHSATDLAAAVLTLFAVRVPGARPTAITLTATARPNTSPRSARVRS